MNRSITIVFFLLPTLVTSAAHADFIALYGDTLHNDCNITDSGCSVYQVEVFHFSAQGARGCRFRAPYQNCLAETIFHNDEPMFAATTGNSQAGVTVDYGNCLSGWIHVMSIVYWDVMFWGPAPCCELPVLPHPGESTGAIEVTDCNGTIVEAGGVSGITDRTPACPCDLPVGIEEQPTWGKVKAMFAD